MYIKMGKFTNTFVAGERAVSTGRTFFMIGFLIIIATIVLSLNFVKDDKLDDNTKDIKKFTIPIVLVCGVIAGFVYYDNKFTQKSNTYAKYKGVMDVASLFNTRK